MIDNNYNKKFRNFFKKFKKEFFQTKNEDEKKYLWNLAIRYIEKNRDFVMQYPISQYWKIMPKNKYNFLEKKFYKEYENQEINLYFHIPFCKTQCTYCNFHIVVWEKKYNLNSKIYIQKLKNEIKNFKENIKNFKIKTIYIWWWTPSFLDENTLDDLLIYINSNFSKHYSENLEFSFETNPDSLTEKKLEILINNWINRLSIWVQTFNNDILKNINRTYNDKKVFEILSLAQDKWFKNINVDMMYWLPWHNYDIMKKDLEIISNLEIQHITYYPLYYYNESILTKNNNNKNNIEEIYLFYDKIVKTLKQKNFTQYWREYFAKDNKISIYQNNYISNSYLYWFWLSSYSFNKKHAFKKESDINNYILNSKNITNYFTYDKKNLDRRLFVLWSRNITIKDKNINNINYMINLSKIAIKLWLIKKYKYNFELTDFWLKYQEILSHIYM